MPLQALASQATQVTATQATATQATGTWTSAMAVVSHLHDGHGRADHHSLGAEEHGHQVGSPRRFIPLLRLHLTCRPSWNGKASWAGSGETAAAGPEITWPIPYRIRLAGEGARPVADGRFSTPSQVLKFKGAPNSLPTLASA